MGQLHVLNLIDLARYGGAGPGQFHVLNPIDLARHGGTGLGQFHVLNPIDLARHGGTGPKEPSFTAAPSKKGQMSLYVYTRL